MKNRLWFRIGTICLAVVMLLSVVAALSYDLSGDGKTNVWDLQLAINQNKTAAEKDGTLREALGGKGDEMHPNAEGYYEIWSQLGFNNFLKNTTKGYKFKLMADFDLGGVDWTPIATFKGELDGNGHTISNFKITKSHNTNMGFIGLLDHNGKDADGNVLQSQVKNLNLKDVEITATADAVYIGMIAGSNRGVITNCTTEGIVNDSRTTLPQKIFVGTIVGRNNDSTPPGKVASGSAKLTTTAGTANAEDKVTGLTSKMATNFAELSYPAGTAEDKQYQRAIGIAGYSTSKNIDTSMIWQDTTNSTALAPKAVQERRNISAQTMYDMCTVEWTPTTNLVYRYYSTGDTPHSSTYKVGITYYGIPYNHGSSSLGRFNAYINNPEMPTTGYYFTDKNVIAAINEAGPGAKVTVTMESGASTTITVPDDWDNSKNEDGTYKYASGAYLAGFTRYIGTDCTSQATWGWRKISAVSGTDFVNPINTSNLFPSEDNIKSAGIVPVDGLVVESPEEGGSGAYGAAINALYNSDIDRIPEALSRASKGDFVVGYQVAGGHCRVLMGDAIAIRVWNGALDNNRSYVITCEQGAGGTRNADNVLISNAKWNIKYTFTDLVRYKMEDDTSKCRYVPLTCAALQKEDTPAAQVRFTYKGATTVSSNFHIEATEFNGKTTYTRTDIATSRSRLVSLDLTTVYPDIKEGDKVTVKLASGDNFTITYGTAY